MFHSFCLNLRKNYLIILINCINKVINVKATNSNKFSRRTHHACLHGDHLSCVKILVYPAPSHHIQSSTPGPTLLVLFFVIDKPENEDIGISGPRPYFTQFAFRHRQSKEMFCLYITETMQIRVER